MWYDFHGGIVLVIAARETQALTFLVTTNCSVIWSCAMKESDRAIYEVTKMVEWELVWTPWMLEMVLYYHYTRILLINKIDKKKVDINE